MRFWFLLWLSWGKITDEELDYGPNSPLIYFSVYTYQGRCSNHGIVPNGPTLCKICEANDDITNSWIKRPTYGKKKYIAKIPWCIG